ncbi:hypothetical protein M0657_009671 [Pyricularia oryzae]|uniref:Uncharacterized protein n=2 Tax=Pyricularia oryzae TaxID=318829 RepID=A0AA97NM04_PYRO3|nr:hypothetical protein OOU_Y34scaffold01085g11 [Pyricularia oryzae Y34]KAI7914103.1 hypothetical protein M0657_009671 [Pyricularia oryzae]KAI7927078.1 hypothetical protein M9X92_002410 [Pyricularia oryzae]
MATSHPKAGHTSTGNTKGRPNMKKIGGAHFRSTGFWQSEECRALVGDGSSRFTKT